MHLHVHTDMHTCFVDFPMSVKRFRNFSCVASHISYNPRHTFTPPHTQTHAFFAHVADCSKFFETPFADNEHALQPSCHTPG